MREMEFSTRYFVADIGWKKYFLGYDQKLINV